MNNIFKKLNEMIEVKNSNDNYKFWYKPNKFEFRLLDDIEEFKKEYSFI